jgi:LuxR family transcriptional regulator, maltose regulon positive regulatory protein
VSLEEPPSNDRPPVPASSPDPVLLRSKLGPPPIRAGLIARARLDGLLEAGAQTRLCLVDAPAGSGKTTLLAQWCLADQASRRVAWLSLDEGDDDPVRFWSYLVEAFRVVEPGFGEDALALLQGPGTADVLTQVILPELINGLAISESNLVLVLDDYHRVTNPDCHETLAFFVDHLPANVHLMIATRVDPPLPLARLRASGELAEIRIAELGFTDTEAASLLNQAMGLELESQDVQRLWEQTEGWVTGLYLAGLWLRGREDPGAFIASLEAGHRHIVDYLGAEVLARQPQPLRAFLVRTSILERLSGSLCDAVLETTDSAEVLVELERTNLFLIPLDEHRRWYRYHQLFGQLLGLELTNQEPELIPVLHRRAAAWHQATGEVEAAIDHATAAGDFAEAATLIAGHWLAYFRRGRDATVERWLGRLPDDVIAADPVIAVHTAWIRGHRGASKQELDRWLGAVEASDQELLPREVAFVLALTRAVHTFNDVGRSLQAARRTVELASPEPSEEYRSRAAAALGRMLYLAGQTTEARAVLAEAARRLPPADQQPYPLINILALLSLLAGEDGDDATAATLAHQAMKTAEAQGVSLGPLSGVAYLALARATARRGGLAEAEQLLERALPVLGVDSFLVQTAQALLELAGVRHARGDTEGADAALQRARQLITQFADPGMLPTLLDNTEQTLHRAARGQPSPRGAALTDRELAVLRMLPTGLSQQEIAQELYVSVTTVRTHIQGVYRKLGATSREEAITHARALGLLPGPASRSNPTGDTHPDT